MKTIMKQNTTTSLFVPEEDETTAESAAGTGTDNRKQKRTKTTDPVGGAPWYLFAAFFMPLVLMYLIYIGMEVFPFGKNSVLVLDLNGQYVYYFEYFREIIHGDASLLYSWTRSLGGEFLGIFAVTSLLVIILSAITAKLALKKYDLCTLIK